MVYMEGDRVRVRTVVTNYQLGASNIEDQDGVVVKQIIPAKKFQERILVALLGGQVGVKFDGEEATTIVWSRCIKGVIPLKNTVGKKSE